MSSRSASSRGGGGGGDRGTRKTGTDKRKTGSGKGDTSRTRSKPRPAASRTGSRTGTRLTSSPTRSPTSKTGSAKSPRRVGMMETERQRILRESELDIDAPPSSPLVFEPPLSQESFPKEEKRHLSTRLGLERLLPRETEEEKKRRRLLSQLIRGGMGMSGGGGGGGGGGIDIGGGGGGAPAPRTLLSQPSSAIYGTKSQKVDVELPLSEAVPPSVPEHLPFRVVSVRTEQQIAEEERDREVPTCGPLSTATRVRSRQDVEEIMRHFTNYVLGAPFEWTTSTINRLNSEPFVKLPPYGYASTVGRVRVTLRVSRSYTFGQVWDMVRWDTETAASWSEREKYGYRLDIQHGKASGIPSSVMLRRFHKIDAPMAPVDVILRFADMERSDFYAMWSATTIEQRCMECVIRGANGPLHLKLALKMVMHWWATRFTRQHRVDHLPDPPFQTAALTPWDTSRPEFVDPILRYVTVSGPGSGFEAERRRLETLLPEERPRVHIRWRFALTSHTWPVIQDPLTGEGRPDYTRPGKQLRQYFRDSSRYVDEAAVTGATDAWLGRLITALGVNQILEALDSDPNYGGIYDSGMNLRRQSVESSTAAPRGSVSIMMTPLDVARAQKEIDREQESATEETKINAAHLYGLFSELRRSMSSQRAGGGDGEGERRGARLLSVKRPLPVASLVDLVRELIPRIDLPSVAGGHLDRNYWSEGKLGMHVSTTLDGDDDENEGPVDLDQEETETKADEEPFGKQESKSRMRMSIPVPGFTIDYDGWELGDDKGLALPFGPYLRRLPELIEAALPRLRTTMRLFCYVFASAFFTQPRSRSIPVDTVRELTRHGAQTSWSRITSISSARTARREEENRKRAQELTDVLIVSGSGAQEITYLPPSAASIGETRVEAYENWIRWFWLNAARQRQHKRAVDIDAESGRLMPSFFPSYRGPEPAQDTFVSCVRLTATGPVIPVGKKTSSGETVVGTAMHELGLTGRLDTDITTETDFVLRQQAHVQWLLEDNALYPEGRVLALAGRNAKDVAISAKGFLDLSDAQSLPLVPILWLLALMRAWSYSSRVSTRARRELKKVIRSKPGLPVLVRATAAYHQSVAEATVKAKEVAMEDFVLNLDRMMHDYDLTKEGKDRRNVAANLYNINQQLQKAWRQDQRSCVDDQGKDRLAQGVAPCPEPLAYLDESLPPLSSFASSMIKGEDKRLTPFSSLSGSPSSSSSSSSSSTSALRSTIGSTSAGTALFSAAGPSRFSSTDPAKSTTTTMLASASTKVEYDPRQGALQWYPMRSFVDDSVNGRICANLVHLKLSLIQQHATLAPGAPYTFTYQRVKFDPRATASTARTSSIELTTMESMTRPLSQMVVDDVLRASSNHDTIRGIAAEWASEARDAKTDFLAWKSKVLMWIRHEWTDINRLPENVEDTWSIEDRMTLCPDDLLGPAQVLTQPEMGGWWSRGGDDGRRLQWLVARTSELWTVRAQLRAFSPEYLPTIQAWATWLRSWEGAPWEPDEDVLQFVGLCESLLQIWKITASAVSGPARAYAPVWKDIHQDVSDNLAEIRYRVVGRDVSFEDVFPPKPPAPVLGPERPPPGPAPVGTGVDFAIPLGRRSKKHLFVVALRQEQMRLLGEKLGESIREEKDLSEKKRRLDRKRQDANRAKESLYDDELQKESSEIDKSLDEVRIRVQAIAHDAKQTASDLAGRGGGGSGTVGGAIGGAGVGVGVGAVVAVARAAVTASEDLARADGVRRIREAESERVRVQEALRVAARARIEVDAGEMLPLWEQYGNSQHLRRLPWPDCTMPAAKMIVGSGTYGEVSFAEDAASPGGIRLGSNHVPIVTKRFRFRDTKTKRKHGETKEIKETKETKEPVDEVDVKDQDANVATFWKELRYSRVWSRIRPEESSTVELPPMFCRDRSASDRIQYSFHMDYWPFTFHQLGDWQARRLGILPWVTNVAASTPFVIAPETVRFYFHEGTLLRRALGDKRIPSDFSIKVRVFTRAQIDQLMQVAEVLTESGILHGDLHDGNVMWRPVGVEGLPEGGRHMASTLIGAWQNTKVPARDDAFLPSQVEPLGSTPLSNIYATQSQVTPIDFGLAADMAFIKESIKTASAELKTRVVASAAWQRSGSVWHSPGRAFLPVGRHKPHRDEPTMGKIPVTAHPLLNHFQMLAFLAPRLSRKRDGSTTMLVTLVVDANRQLSYVSWNSFYEALRSLEGRWERLLGREAPGNRDPSPAPPSETEWPAWARHLYNMGLIVTIAEGHLYVEWQRQTDRFLHRAQPALKPILIGSLTTRPNVVIADVSV